MRSPNTFLEIVADRGTNRFGVSLNSSWPMLFQEEKSEVVRDSDIIELFGTLAGHERLQCRCSEIRERI